MKLFKKFIFLVSLLPTAVLAGKPTTYTSSLFSDCSGINPDDALDCWTREAFQWTQGIIWTISVAVVVFAGVVYMTSAGDTKRVAYSKKLLWGAFSAVAVVVLGRFFLTKVVGVPWI